MGMLSGAGMRVAVLAGVAALLFAVWLVLHVVMIVQGFKTSPKWGLVALFIPFGSLAFAFAKSGRKVLTGIFLVALLGWIACGWFASCQIANAFSAQAEDPATKKAAEEAGKKGMDEFDKQIKDLENLDDIKL
jgi:hypothetical protein